MSLLNKFNSYSYDVNIIQYTLIILFAYVVSAYSVHTFKLERHAKDIKHHVTTGILWILIMNTIYLYTNQSKTEMFKNPWYVGTIMLTPLLYGLMVTHNESLQYNSENIMSNPMGLATIIIGISLFGFSLFNILRNSPEVRILNIVFLIASVALFIFMQKTAGEELQFHHYILFTLIASQATTNTNISALLGGFSAGMVCHGLVSYRETSFYKSGKEHKIIN